jgi:hypothetical protein
MLLQSSVATLLLVVSCALAAAEDLDLKPYFSGEGKYRVLLPDPVKTQDAKMGGTVTKSATSVVSGNAAFAVSYADLGFEVPADQVKTVLAGFHKSIAGKDGKVLSAKDAVVSDDKLPCRDALIQQPKSFARVRALVVGKRVYMIAAMGTKEFVTSKDADKVLDSFSIVK